MSEARHNYHRFFVETKQEEVVVTDLTQQEADELIAMTKHRVEDTIVLFPPNTPALSINLTSADKREEFVLDFRTGRVKLSKITLQNRAKKNVVLVRVDLDGPPHRNPDGSTIPCPHIHVYREGFGDKWAQSLPAGFADASDPWTVLQDFLAFCNIVPHNFSRSLLS